MPELRSSGGFGNGEVTEPLWASDVCDKELNYALRDSLTHPSCLNEIQSGLWWDWGDSKHYLGHIQRWDPPFAQHINSQDVELS